MPRKNGWKVEKIVRKVNGLSNEARPEKDAGRKGPSCCAGIAPQEGGGTTPVMFPPRARTRGQLDSQTMVGARSTGTVEAVRVPFQGRRNEQAWKERFYVEALQDDQFERPGIQQIAVLVAVGTLR